MAVAPKNPNQIAEEMNKENNQNEFKTEIINKNSLPELKKNRSKNLISNSIYHIYYL